MRASEVGEFDPRRRRDSKILFTVTDRETLFDTPNPLAGTWLGSLLPPPKTSTSPARALMTGTLSSIARTVAETRRDLVG